MARTKRLLVLGVLATGIVAVSLAVADEEKNSETPAPSAVGEKFSHDQHAKNENKVVTDKNCSSCHGTDPKGALSKPGKTGHKPCLNSGCHLNNFLGTADSLKNSEEKKDKELYAKSTRFCLGCHNSSDGSPPKNYTKAKADNVYVNNTTPEYHVELDHLKHVGFKNGKCRDCHVVDPSSNMLKEDSPGHLECSQCHTGKTDAPAMSKCAACHSAPGSTEYFPKEDERPGSETRACGSEGHLALAKKRKKSPDQVPCFKHERKEHRFWSKNRNSRKNWEQGEPLQCGQCHFMFADETTWKAVKGDKHRKGDYKYQTLKQIKAAPYMDPGEGEAHDRCGNVPACHGGDFGGSCTKCHKDQNPGGSSSLYE